MNTNQHHADPDCIFCKIIAGQIPCHKIHEDDHTLAFLDIGPISRGHILIIPKHHAATLAELPAEAAAACGAVMPKLAAAVQQATECPASNVLQNNGQLSGQAVFHVHFHIIPRYENGSGLNFQWPAGSLSDNDAAELKQTIISYL
ncbi:HIT family protein [Poriferisphaera sp. WC338]|uniref:HIT family protein n=1 Tax=Poriferisphaera sp. WC338 TaxID=3425129 RepID=UPI003D81C47C